MQDYTFLDDYDYTLCSCCHSSIQPYNNTSITVIITDNSNINLYTKTLSKYHHLNCQKCGLYIEIHPQIDGNDPDINTKRIFICSKAVPHKYCLCYHCGLLYGINPNQTSINNINNINQLLTQPIQSIQPKNTPVIQNNRNSNRIKDIKENIIKKKSEISKNKLKKNKKKIRLKSKNKDKDKDAKDVQDVKDEIISISLDIDADDNDNDNEFKDNLHNDNTSSDDTNDNERLSAIQKSYLNMIALKKELNTISNKENQNQNQSAPSSPNFKSKSKPKHNQYQHQILKLSKSTSKSASFQKYQNNQKKIKKKRVRTKSNHSSSHSLSGSPLLTSTPSPRLIIKDLDIIEKKWHLITKQNKLINKENIKSKNKKIQKQQKTIQDLEAIKRKLTQTAIESAKYAKLFRNGTYSKQHLSKSNKLLFILD